MLYKIIETDSFRQSFDETFEYILTNFKNKKIVDDMLVSIDKASELLTIFPDMFGTFEPTYDLKYEIRKFPVKEYFVFYIIDDIKEGSAIFENYSLKLKEAEEYNIMHPEIYSHEEFQNF